MANTDLPAQEHVAVVPSDSVKQVWKSRAIRIGGAGDIAVRMNNVDVIYSVVAGERLELVCEWVLLTGTTATNIVFWR